MREITRVSAAVLVTALILWCLGLWTWISSTTMSRWPWLLERYALIFPAALILALLGLRRWGPARSSFLGAALGGAAVGLVTSLFALGLAQLVTAPERAKFLQGLRLDGGMVGFLAFGMGTALFQTLGWVYGSVAALLALIGRRAEQWHGRVRDEAGSRGWLWLLMVLLVVGVLWIVRLNLFVWSPAQGSRVSDHEGAGLDAFFFLALLTVIPLVFALVLFFGRRRKRASEVDKRTELRVLVPFAMLLGLSCLACESAKSAPQSYFSLAHQTPETLSGSLFREVGMEMGTEEMHWVSADADRSGFARPAR